jgi:hypothetical protein
LVSIVVSVSIFVLGQGCDGSSFGLASRASISFKRSAGILLRQILDCICCCWTGNTAIPSSHCSRWHWQLASHSGVMNPHSTQRQTRTAIVHSNSIVSLLFMVLVLGNPSRTNQMQTTARGCLSCKSSLALAVSDLKRSGHKTSRICSLDIGKASSRISVSTGGIGARFPIAAATAFRTLAGTCFRHAALIRRGDSRLALPAWELEQGRRMQRRGRC